MGLNQHEPLDENTRRIESKDSMWKPAPIIGREMGGNAGQYGNAQQQIPITQQLQRLRQENAQIEQLQSQQQMQNQQQQPIIQQQQNYMLPSHFDRLRQDNKFDDLMNQINQKNQERDQHQQQFMNLSNNGMP